MTCIVYRDGVLACDSWAAEAWTLIGRFNKIGRRGRLLFSAAGECAFAQRFTDWVQGDDFLAWLEGEGTPPDLASSVKPDKEATGTLYLPDGSCVRFEGSMPPYRLTGPFFAQGSGAWIATGALAKGATAAEAVELAAEWDYGTQLPVRILSH